MIRASANRPRPIPSLATGLLALASLAAPAIAQIPAPASAPAPTARNAVYFELLGNAIVYSVNYDRRFTNTWTGRAGFMVASFTGVEPGTGNRAAVDIAIIPVMANALLGRGSHRLELGVGPLFAIGGGEIENAELGDVERFSGGGVAGVTTTFGYRRQPLDGGFLFRAALNPFYSAKPQLWGGVSAGWSF